MEDSGKIVKTIIHAGTKAVPFVPGTKVSEWGEKNTYF